MANRVPPFSNQSTEKWLILDYGNFKISFYEEPLRNDELQKFCLEVEDGANRRVDTKKGTVFKYFESHKNVLME